MARADRLRAYGCYCGCCGAVAGGGVAVGSVGVEAGNRYQTISSATTTAAAMMSNLLPLIANGAQESFDAQCIPVDEALLPLGSYKEFLAQRRKWVAKRLNEFLGGKT